MDDTLKLADFCKDTLDLQHASLGDEFYYKSLPLAIIDAIFSIQSNYKSTTNVVKKYSGMYTVNGKHNISQLIEIIKQTGNIEKFANNALNMQRAPGGALKAENVYKWAEIFQRNGIETIVDFRNNMNEDIEKELKSIKGQGGDGVAIQYLYMLCGDDNACKPDTHLLRFLADALDRDVRADEAQRLMEGAVVSLKSKYPQITVRLLDNTIWKYQKQVNLK